MTWMAENAGTALIALVLLGAVCAIVVGLLRDRKKGKSSCGCTCAHCALSGSCHKGR